MKKIFLALSFILFTNNFATIEDTSEIKNIGMGEEFRPSLELLLLVDHSYLQARDVLLDKNFYNLELDSYSKIFFDLKNLLFLVIDFYNNSEKRVIRHKVIKAFSDLADYLFHRISIIDVQKEYCNIDFDFWKKFISFEDEHRRENFLLQTMNGSDTDVVVGIVKNFFIVLSEYAYSCLLAIENQIQDFMDFDFTKMENFDQDKDFIKGKGKKKLTASYIFGAISGICSQAGRLASKEGQGVLGIFSSIFGAASNLLAAKASEEFEAQEMQELQELKSGFFSKILYNRLTKKILAAVFKVIQSYLHEKLTDLLQYLSEKLIDLICNGEKEEINGTPFDSFVNNYNDDSYDDSFDDEYEDNFTQDFI